ncbi:MAG: glycosyltransferase [Bacteroidetes bacterium]|nr:glycosyltransferase [Bacteroidota bacterium]
MHVFILSIFWLLISFSLLYILIIGVITFGLFRMHHFRNIPAGKLPDISVVVAVRNEQENIEKLLQALQQQHFLKEQLEVVIVNDHSEDYTKQLIEHFKTENKDIEIKLVQLNGKGKKAAISEGIGLAKNNLIITTDGDCTMGTDWLRRLAEYYKERKPKLIAGPVVYETKKGFLQHFYMLDFMSLVASGAGSLGAGLPLMANGANLAFEKQTYLDVVNAQSGKSFASGDDVFLLHAIAKKFGINSVHFIKDELAIVKTRPPVNFKSFISQRKRWASKAIAYTSWWAILVSMGVFMLNLMLVLALVTAFFKPWFLIIFGLFVLLKILIEFPMLQNFAEFVNRKKSVPYLFVFGFIYPFYIVFAAISSFFIGYSWRGRKYLK